MRHLITHVLSEAQPLLRHSHPHQELVDTGKEIRNRLVGNHTLGNATEESSSGQSRYSLECAYGAYDHIQWLASLATLGIRSTCMQVS